MWKIILFALFFNLTIWCVHSQGTEDICGGDKTLHFVNDFTCCACYFTCYAGSSFPQRCPNGFIFDGTGGTCSPADTTTCEPCPPAGDDEAILFTPVDGSCIDYNVCINGTLQETRNCSIGTRFNPTTKRCELTGSVKCQADVTCPPQEWIIPDPNTCDHFVLCQDEEVLEIKQCAPGLLFDRDLLECVVGTVCPYDTSIKIPLYDPSIPKAPVVFN